MAERTWIRTRIAFRLADFQGQVPHQWLPLRGGARENRTLGRVTAYALAGRCITTLPLLHLPCRLLHTSDSVLRGVTGRNSPSSTVPSSIFAPLHHLAAPGLLPSALYPVSHHSFTWYRHCWQRSNPARYHRATGLISTDEFRKSEGSSRPTLTGRAMGFRACYSVFNVLVIFNLVEVTGFEPALSILQGWCVPVTTTPPCYAERPPCSGGPSALISPRPT